MARRERALLALSIDLLAAAAHGYQVLLFRLLAIVQWNPFGATIVSLALLAHGAAGTALALTGQRLSLEVPLKPHPCSLNEKAGSIRAISLAGSRAAFARFRQLRVTLRSSARMRCASRALTR